MKFETVKKARGTALMFLIVFSAMTFVPLFLGLYFVIASPGSEESAVILAGLVFLIPTGFLFLQVFAWYTGYFINKRELTLQGVYNKKTITADQLEKIEPLEDEEAKRLIEEPMAAVNRKSRSGDLKGWYRENKRYAELLKFCTVPVIHSSAGGTTAQSETYTGSKVQRGVSMLLLTLKSGEEYILTPVDVGDFSDQVKMLIGVAG